MRSIIKCNIAGFKTQIVYPSYILEQSIFQLCIKLAIDRGYDLYVYLLVWRRWGGSKQERQIDYTISIENATYQSTQEMDKRLTYWTVLPLGKEKINE